MTLALDFEWDAEDQARLRRKLADRRTRLGPMCQVFADPVERFCETYGVMVAEEARRRAPQDTGRLRSGIFVRFAQGAVQVGSKARYGGFSDQGTRPHWPPVRALQGWARRHGIPAFLVARKIAREGTDATRWLTGAAQQVEARHLPRLLRDTATAISMNWGKR